jgi:hypothetical protein
MGFRAEDTFARVVCLLNELDNTIVTLDTELAAPAAADLRKTLQQFRDFASDLASPPTDGKTLSYGARPVPGESLRQLIRSHSRRALQLHRDLQEWYELGQLVGVALLALDEDQTVAANCVQRLISWVKHPGRGSQELVPTLQRLLRFWPKAARLGPRKFLNKVVGTSKYEYMPDDAGWDAFVIKRQLEALNRQIQFELRMVTRPKPQQGAAQKNPTASIFRERSVEARDKWIYEQCCNGTYYMKIKAEVNRRKGWSKIASIQGIRSAALRYARRHNLPPPPPRKAFGRDG